MYLETIVAKNSPGLQQRNTSSERALLWCQQRQRYKKYSSLIEPVDNSTLEYQRSWHILPKHLHRIYAVSTISVFSLAMCTANQLPTCHAQPITLFKFRQWWHHVYSLNTPKAPSIPARTHRLADHRLVTPTSEQPTRPHEARCQLRHYKLGTPAHLSGASLPTRSAKEVAKD